MLECKRAAAWAWALALVALAPAWPARAQAPAPTRDQAAEALLNQLLQALQLPDEAQSAKAVLPLVQKSLLAKDGSDLSPDLRRFSFKKAHERARLYAAPVKITRVRETAQTAVGLQETAEAGQVVDYFIARKDAGGLPAPVKVFFPRAGGPPRVVYLGAL